MKPTLGRIVMYVPEWGGSNPFPAIITEVLKNEAVRVGVFGTTYYPARAIHLEPQGNSNPVPGTWYWPPREPS